MGGPPLLVGGGSGVVPLMAMLRARRAAPDPTPALLLYSSRTIGDVIYRAEPTSWRQSPADRSWSWP